MGYICGFLFFYIYKYLWFPFVSKNKRSSLLSQSLSCQARSWLATFGNNLAFNHFCRSGHSQDRTCALNLDSLRLLQFYSLAIEFNYSTFILNFCSTIFAKTVILELNTFKFSILILREIRDHKTL